MFIIGTQIVIFENFGKFQKMSDFSKISKLSEDKKYSTRRIFDFFEDSEKLGVYLSNSSIPGCFLLFKPSEGGPVSDS